jgi:hypothetical protein
MVDILPAAPLGTTDQMSPDRAAVPFAAVCTFGQLLLDLGLTEDQWANVGAADLVEPYRSTCGPDAFPIDEAVRLQNLYTVSFLQRHQVGDERYGWFLTDEATAREPNVEFESR